MKLYYQLLFWKKLLNPLCLVVILTTRIRDDLSSDVSPMDALCIATMWTTSCRNERDDLDDVLVSDEVLVTIWTASWSGRSGHTRVDLSGLVAISTTKRSLCRPWCVAQTVARKLSPKLPPENCLRNCRLMILVRNEPCVAVDWNRPRFTMSQRKNISLAVNWTKKTKMQEKNCFGETVWTKLQEKM